MSENDTLRGQSNMKFYILPTNFRQEDLLKDTHILGEQSFKVFWAGTGFNNLQRMIEQAPDVLEHIIIKDDQGKDYSVENFLDKIKKLQIRTQ